MIVVVKWTNQNRSYFIHHVNSGLNESANVTTDFVSIAGTKFKDWNSLEGSELRQSKSASPKEQNDADEEQLLPYI